LSLIRIRRTGRAGVRGAIVALKRGNSRGAKGSRKMDGKDIAYGTPPPIKCPEHRSWLSLMERVRYT
jgi:hypothetical protein